MNFDRKMLLRNYNILRNMIEVIVNMGCLLMNENGLSLWHKTEKRSISMYLSIDKQKTLLAYRVVAR
ncbi:protein of unknown function [Candidatus Nitrosotalea okcheonensis]|uniref:Uncharacterized protein n=1 Tax=Candidatus Nitrosotalea okcheonensis TaxID=1903276 RepID=A0A2H1FF51_9ARCH|nr:protein of unknown function [Candidatus Nitrosotalea okcheonensis]